MLLVVCDDSVTWDDCDVFRRIILLLMMSVCETDDPRVRTGGTRYWFGGSCSQLLLGRPCSMFVTLSTFFFKSCLGPDWPGQSNPQAYWFPIPCPRSWGWANGIVKGVRIWCGSAMNELLNSRFTSQGSLVARIGDKMLSIYKYKTEFTEDSQKWRKLYPSINLLRLERVMDRSKSEELSTEWAGVYITNDVGLGVRRRYEKWVREGKQK